MSLAEGLVTAARSVLCPDEDRPYYTESQLAGIERDANAAVVAVLRRLVEEERDWREHHLAALADEIVIRGALADEIEGGSRG